MAAAGILAVLFVVPGRAEAGCSVAVTGVSFGSYDVYAPAPLDSTGSVIYNCGAGTATIAIDLSRGSGGTFTPRTLLSGASPLDYNLYLDAARTTVWGDNTSGTSNYTAASPPANTDVPITIFARVPAEQDAAVGSYSDTVVVTINF
jgi:spore coat protein U-like protein